MYKAPTLAEALRAAKSPLDYVRNNPDGRFVFPRVPAEYTNWRDEQRSWRHTAALLDQSHHMTDLYVKGPDALKLFTDLGVNTFATFNVGQGKQFVCVNYEGNLIGDAVLYRLGEDSFDLVGHSAHNWVQYHIDSGKYNATYERDENSNFRAGDPSVYRFQVQGPNALKVFEKAIGGPVPDVKPWHSVELTIGGCKAFALRFSIQAGAEAAFEIHGPWADAEKVRAALVEAGQGLGLRQVGSRAYPNTDVGWIPTPFPPLYVGDKYAGFREWLSVYSYEGQLALGGSFHSERIEDYYVRPHEFDYGRIINFNHDFVGREALEKMTDQPHRKKVSFFWNQDDVREKIFGSLTGGKPRAKYFELPIPHNILNFDKITVNGKTVGLSMFVCFSANENCPISLGVIDPAFATPGTEVVLTWGDAAKTAKPWLEDHEQVEIRAVVKPAPYQTR